MPIDACYINEGWKKAGMASIIIARKHTNGNYTIGIYLVDTFALGTKDSFFRFNAEQQVLDEIINRKLTNDRTIQVEYPLAHNIIYGANGFAEDNGFMICKEFEITRFILEEDTEDIELIDIEFGKDGEAFLIV